MLVLMMTLILATEPQEPQVEVTRSEELQMARENKAEQLEPPKRTALEKGLYQVKEGRVIERFKAGLHGFHPMVGGMKSGAGFALGTLFTAGKFGASAQLSIKGYQRYEVKYAGPQFLNGRVSTNLRGEYRNYSEETFYGLGNDSLSEHRTTYRLEDYTIGGDVALQVKPNVKVGANLSWIETNIGRRTESRFPWLGDMAYAETLQAFPDQPDYLHTGLFVDVENRDEPGNPRSGSRYAAKWTAYHDQTLGQYGFNRFDVDVQQYFPFFNDRRVIALRARTTLTQTADGQEVPFYMMPTLGGSQDLRGFSEYRFRDRNMVVFNAEYRWEAFSGLDMALFADAGQVAPNLGEFDFGDMKTAAGIGFRFNTAKSVFARVDVGFSQEGPRLHVNFSHVF
jgi:outer membrane protein assembly factor BamA